MKPPFPPAKTETDAILCEMYFSHSLVNLWLSGKGNWAWNNGFRLRKSFGGHSVESRNEPIEGAEGVSKCVKKIPF
jgi:hypothetical protein